MMRLILYTLFVALLGACSSSAYYLQGIRGQMDLLERAQPIQEILGSTQDATLKKKLGRVVAIRDFASRELGLPENASYRTYADIGRRFVLWNVFATPEFSLQPRQWCFPIAGCVNYRGYFDEAGAREEAAHFAAAGDDVYVGGVPAYSTLGYFNDPILSTFIRYPDTEVARLVFHELAHQLAYAKDDTVFNESFAVAVEEEGVARWLAAQNDPALTAQFATTQRYRDGFRTLVSRTRSRLAKVYASSESDAAKRAEKADALAAMRTDYVEMKNQWGGYAAYDSWFAQGPNNAGLAAVGLYTQKVPEFRALLASVDGDLPRFYAKVKALAALPEKSERNTALAAAVASTRASASANSVPEPPEPE
jgi:predicted aminopeptidase